MVTAGYEYRAHMGDKDPNVAAFHGRWLRTGDKGWVDANGYLTLSGRFKEIISRGGEKISPFEVEDVLRGHQAVRLLQFFHAHSSNFSLMCSFHCMAEASFGGA